MSASYRAADAESAVAATFAGTKEAEAAHGEAVSAIDDDLTVQGRTEAPSQRRWFNLIPPTITFIAFVGVWYLYSWSRFDNEAQRRNALPYPHVVITDGFLPLWDAKNGLRPILEYMIPTIRVTIVGLAIAVVLGVTFAIIMNLSKNMERAFFPYAVVLQTVPILAITPLLTQLFGEEMGVRLVVVVLIAIFPIITNTLFGMQSTDQLHHDLFTLNHVGRMTRLWKLELPSALPAMMAGLRIASGGAVIGAIVADFFFVKGDKGIGYYIRNKQQRASERPEMFSGTIMASLFGVVMFLIMGWITTRAIRNWHESARSKS